MKQYIAGMIRQFIKKNHGGLTSEFRYRGEEQTRIETFSDAVFALAVTLMVLSSTIPKTYQELVNSLSDIVPFGICITLLTIIWYQHYIFFLRYGLRDAKVVVINTILLFFVLVYVYPLKFLFTFMFDLFSALAFNDKQMLDYLLKTVITRDELNMLMVTYGLGAASIFLGLAWLYSVALKRKKDLSLYSIELFYTRTSFYHNLIMASVPLLSIIVAFISIIQTVQRFSIAGFIYWLYPFILPFFHAFRKKKLEQLRLKQ